jgi:hypothetical protein
MISTNVLNRSALGVRSRLDGLDVPFEATRSHPAGHRPVALQRTCVRVPRELSPDMLQECGLSRSARRVMSRNADPHQKQHE